MAAAGPPAKLLVIAGPTASGKSALALRLAKELNGEIISADSWTVYKDFDIGTGKPTKSQQKAVKHYLIDVREAADGFSAPLFKQLAKDAITDIQNQGKLPIMVGGTGLYIDSVLYDFGFLPSVTQDERTKLDRMDLADLLARAKNLKIDLTDIDIRNKRRVIRAIEAKGEKPTKQQMRSDTLVVGLQLPLEELKSRITRRVDKMLGQGLEKEVQPLADRYGWNAEPMKGIGYREWREYFEGTQSLEDTRQRIISATNNLAKRQRTWLRRNPHITWFSNAEQAYGYIIGRLNT